MDFINSTINACIEVSSVLKKGGVEFGNKLEKGAGGDISRVADMKAEEIFVKHLSKYGKIISEESGVIGSGDDEIVLDPLDGSDNYVSCFPYFGCSVALRKKGKVVKSLIANFANRDIFVKYNNSFKYAKINELDFSDVISDKYATIGVVERAYAFEKDIEIIQKIGIKYRSPGAIALSLAYASRLKFVLFKGNPREYDIEAGLHMCSNLNIYKNSDYLLVSRDQSLFEKLKEVIEIEFR